MKITSLLLSLLAFVAHLDAIFAWTHDFGHDFARIKERDSKSVSSQSRPVFVKSTGMKKRIARPKVFYNRSDDALKPLASSFADDSDIGFDHEEDKLEGSNFDGDDTRGSGNSYDNSGSLIQSENGDQSNTQGQDLMHRRSPMPFRVPVRTTGFQSPAKKARKTRPKGRMSTVSMADAYSYADDKDSLLNSYDSNGILSGGYEDVMPDSGKSNYADMDLDSYGGYDDHYYGHNVFGIPGIDFPAYSSPPRTGFSCANQMYPGYYADVESNCQAFYVCQEDGRQDAFLCPNATIFNQQYFVCDWYFNVDCSLSKNYFSLNGELYVEKGYGLAGGLMPFSDTYGSTRYPPTSSDMGYEKPLANNGNSDNVKSDLGFDTDDDGSIPNSAYKNFDQIYSGIMAKEATQKSRQPTNRYAMANDEKWINGARINPVRLSSKHETKRRKGFKDEPSHSKVTKNS